jgi:hypothetical protein
VPRNRPNPPSNRNRLIEYALRRLGHPVIQVNVADEQLEDCLDDSMQFFSEYHFDGVEKVFMPHKVSAEDIINESIVVPDSITSITRVFPFSRGNASSFFNFEYQMRLADWDVFYGLARGGDLGLGHYEMVKEWLNTVNFVLRGEPTVIFNRHTNLLRMEIDWDELTVDNYIIVEGYRVIDPEVYGDVYNDIFLKRYLVAKIKQQWGNNIKKYSGAKLPGGTEFNGQQIYDEATDELDKLETEMVHNNSFPPDFMVG